MEQNLKCGALYINPWNIRVSDMDADTYFKAISSLQTNKKVGMLSSFFDVPLGQNRYR
jgi:hypothetical protein